jgi:hypothetical protein
VSSSAINRCICAKLIRPQSRNALQQPRLAAGNVWQSVRVGQRISAMSSRV